MPPEPGIALADEAATLALGRALAPLLAAGDVVTLSGPLGSGKTTFARGVLAGLGLAGEAPSPSYPIVIAYAPPEVRLATWHVDLYRIAAPAEVEELGLEDAATDAAMIVEWPERLDGAWWTRALALSLAPAGAGRRLTWSTGPAWDGRWPPAHPG